MSIDSVNVLLANGVTKTSKSMRWAWRRFRMRESVKQYLSKPYLLTKEQKDLVRDYWGNYTSHCSTLWHELYYQKTGRFDVRFIPDDIMFTEIEGYLNDWGSSRGFDNKCNYDLYFPEVVKPKTLFRRMQGIYHDGDWNIISEENAIRIVVQNKGGAIKQAQEVGYGIGVKIWNDEENSVEELRDWIKILKGDIIAQDLIVEHPDLKVFRSKSVSCIRVMTMQTDKGVEYICGYLRIGQGNSKVDFDGGCVSSVHEDGSLFETGFDNNTCNPITAHQSGIPFKGYIIPCYDRIKEKALELHKKIGDFRIVSWDFSVDPKGNPVLIEVNMLYGGIMYHQLGIGPLFGDNTETILNECFRKRLG